MEFFARQQVVDALIEGVVLSHEHLPFPPDALTLLGFLEIVADRFKAGVDVLVPGAVISFAQHLRQSRRSVSEIKPARQDHHPGAIRRVGAATLGARRIDAERNVGAGANGRKVFSLHRTSAPAQWLAPFFPAFAPDLEVVFLGNLQQKLGARRVVSRTNETNVRMVGFSRWDWRDGPIRSRRQKLGRKSKRFPFGLAATDEQ